MANKLRVSAETLDLFHSSSIDRQESERTTFRISKPAKHAMDMMVIEDGYGMRGKSRWIMGAVETFLSPETWGEGREQIWKRIVIDTELYKEALVKDAINIPEKTRVVLWHAAISAALYGAELDEDPVYLEISISSVIRAAVMWKIGLKN